MAFNNKSFFIERTDYSLRLMRVVQGGDGDLIDEVREAPLGPAEEMKAFIQNFSDDSFGGFLRAHCAIYPPGRVVRSCSLTEDPQSGETKSLQQVVTSQFRVDPEAYALTALHADDGTFFDPSGRTQRELLGCGAPLTELREAQEFLVGAGIYPLRMELGSVASVGLLIRAMRAQQIGDPILVLELGEERSNVLIVGPNRLESAKPLPLGLNSMISGVRAELGLKDENAARRLFYSDSFDFREMGPRLIERLFRELQSMTGFYEVQTGQSITRMICNLLPSKLGWLSQTFATSLGMTQFELDVPLLLGELRIGLAETDPPLKLAPPLGLLGLIANQEVAV